MSAGSRRSNRTFAGRIDVAYQFADPPAGETNQRGSEIELADDFDNRLRTSSGRQNNLYTRKQPID